MTRTATPLLAATGTEISSGVALVFPGQGSQRPGMAQPWRDTPGFALWAEADDILGRDVSVLGLDATAEQLTEPVNCQVALYVHHAVLFANWRAAGRQAAVAAGHSLGEYNALHAAGVLTFADGLRLVDQRARATQAAASTNPGGMVACLGGDTAALLATAEQAGVFVANDNAEGQLVLSGSNEALERFAAAAAEQRAKIVRLGVGAAYHSPLMASAVGPLVVALERTSFAEASIPVIANVDAAPHTSAGEWPALLEAQLTAPVRWRETLLALRDTGIAELVELGASPVLAALAKRVTPELARQTISTPDALETT